MVGTLKRYVENILDRKKNNLVCLPSGCLPKKASKTVCLAMRPNVKRRKYLRCFHAS